MTMTMVNMLDAKTRLSKLVEAVESGAEREVIIARNGKPAARLVPIEQKPKIRLGLNKGKYPSISLEEFNALDEQIAKLFNEGPIFPEEK
jgi:prevent-host-death family protein